MNLKEYIGGLQQFLKANPKLGTSTVVTSADDEGNYFNEVYYSPSAGNFDGREFDATDGDSSSGANAVCVN